MSNESNTFTNLKDIGIFLAGLSAAAYVVIVYADKFNSPQRNIEKAVAEFMVKSMEEAKKIK